MQFAHFETIAAQADIAGAHVDDQGFQASGLQPVHIEAGDQRTDIAIGKGAFRWRGLALLLLALFGRRLIAIGINQLHFICLEAVLIDQPFLQQEAELALGTDRHIQAQQADAALEALVAVVGHPGAGAGHLQVLDQIELQIALHPQHRRRALGKAAVYARVGQHQLVFDQLEAVRAGDFQIAGNEFAIRAHGQAQAGLEGVAEHAQLGAACVESQLADTTAIHRFEAFSGQHLVTKFKVLYHQHGKLQAFVADPQLLQADWAAFKNTGQADG